MNNILYELKLYCIFFNIYGLNKVYWNFIDNEKLALFLLLSNKLLINAKTEKFIDGILILLCKPYVFPLTTFVKLKNADFFGK